MKLLFPAFAKPAFVLAGLLFAQPVSADPLPNAWQITDASSTNGTLFRYSTNLVLSQRQAATNAGFRLAVNARLVTDFGGSKTMTMGYGVGSRRFLIWFELNGAGELTAELEGNSTNVLTANGTGTNLYHTHEIVYNPATGKASYAMDGQVLTTNWSSSGTNLTDGQVTWGAATSLGQGQMNFHSVTFEITNTVVATYDAGTEGDSVANPIGPGWTPSSATPPGGISTNAISPDTALLPAATTLAADQFMPNGARLNGQVKPSGSPTSAFFQWGTDTNYANATTIQPVGPGPGISNVNSVLSGLAVGPNYHYRMVASNAFGVVAGTNRSFNLASLLPVATTLPPNPAAIQPHQAAVAGVVNPSGLSTTTWFEWGTTTNYGSFTTVVNVPGGVSSSNLTRTITGLVKGTTYHFRCVATNNVGTSRGADVAFSTPLSFAVNTLADSGSGSLRESIANALAGDTIAFATNGTIVLTSGELLISKNLTIAGPGPLAVAVSGNNSSRAFSIASGVAVNVSGLTVRNGRTPNGANGVNTPGLEAAGGGGIFNQGTLTLSNCIITANVTGNGGQGFSPGGGPSQQGAPGTAGGAGGNGAGVFNMNNLTLIACTVRSNTCGSGGNGGDGANASVTTNGIPVGGNGGNGGSGGEGGGIYNNGVLTITACTLNGNRAGNGGAGGAGGDDEMLTGGNGGQGGRGGDGGDGGAIRNAGSLGLTQSTVTGNKCGNGGGGDVGGRASGSPANPGLGGDGGDGGSGGGGGSIHSSGTIGLVACTIAGNTAGNAGNGASGGTAGLPGAGGDGGNGGDAGGVLNTAAAAFTTLRNTLIALNGPGIGGLGAAGGASGSLGFGPDVNGVFTSAGHNLVGINDGSASLTPAVGDQIGSLGLPINPLLGALAGNGGPTFTMALLNGSPAMEAGDDALTNNFATEQRGFPRLAGVRLDIGAFERQATGPPIPTLLLNPKMLSNRALMFSFSNTADVSFTVLAATNVALPLNQWIILAPPTQQTPGQYFFTDTAATNYPARFYQLLWP